MGVKRFLVAGGMASLILIGVVLIGDAKGFAKDNQGPVSTVTGLCENNPTCQQVKDQPVSTATGLCEDNPTCKQAMPNGGPGDTPSGPGDTPSGPSDTPSGPSGTPSGPSGTPSGGGMELVALGAGGTSGTGEGDGTGGTAGAVAATATATALPETGGPSRVLLPTAGPLLLAIVLLLGFGLWMAAFVRSVRS